MDKSWIILDSNRLMIILDYTLPMIDDGFASWIN